MNENVKRDLCDIDPTFIHGNLKVSYFTLAYLKTSSAIFLFVRMHTFYSIGDWTFLAGF